MRAKSETESEPGSLVMGPKVCSTSTGPGLNHKLSNRGIVMPVKLESFAPLSEDEFTALLYQKTRKTDPAMAALLAKIATGQPVRVPLVEGQSARGLRAAISRAATSRGLSVETVEGAGFVAVRKAEASGPQRGKLAPSGGGQRRRGRPPKLQA